MAAAKTLAVKAGISIHLFTLPASLPACLVGVPTTSALALLKWIHGQTPANRTKPGASFQLQKWLCVCTMQLHCFETKLPNLLLKTRPEQLLGYFPLDIALPDGFLVN